MTREFLLDTLTAIEAKFRAAGQVRFIPGDAYPVSEVAFGQWLKQQAEAGQRVKGQRYVSFRARIGAVYQEVAR